MNEATSGIAITLKTLRFRLAVWNAIVVILTAALVLLTLRQGVQRALVHGMDQVLSEDAQEIELALRQFPASEFELLKEELDRKAIGHRHHRWFVQLIDVRGDVVWSSVDAPADMVFPATTPAAGLHTSAGYRFLLHPVAPPALDVARFCVGSSLRPLQQDMARIDQLVLLTAALAMCVAPACGFWLARQSTRALRTLLQAANRLRPSHLDERLPIRGTGDELDQLAKTINALLDRIAIDTRYRREFLANAAHELRTPLAAIRSTAEVGLSGDRSLQEYQDLLADIIDRGSALETLVNQLLLLTEVLSQLPQRGSQPVSLDEVVARSIEMFQGVAESQRVSLHLDRNPPLRVPGNRYQLTQVVHNLLDNAIKYTPAGGRVTVDMRRLTDEPMMRLTVADTGIGIDDDDLPHIFERFFRADRSRTRLSDVPSTGLGLSICEAVVTAHGGTIRCDSRVGQGTVMSVELPVCTDGTE